MKGEQPVGSFEHLAEAAIAFVCTDPNLYEEAGNVLINDA